MLKSLVKLFLILNIFWSGVSLAEDSELRFVGKCTWEGFNEILEKSPFLYIYKSNDEKLYVIYGLATKNEALDSHSEDLGFGLPISLAYLDDSLSWMGPSGQKNRIRIQNVLNEVYNTVGQGHLSDNVYPSCFQRELLD